MAEERKVHLIWKKANYSDFVEKEHENSYFTVVVNPSPDMEEKYTNRVIINKKACETAE